MPDAKRPAKRASGPAKAKPRPKRPAEPAPSPAAKEPTTPRAKPEAEPPSKPTSPSAQPPVSTRTVIDASGLVLGRAASRIAKRLMKGESIVVVNAEKSVVTGARTAVLEEFRARRARGSVRSGPHYPRYPDRIFRRTVRGMVPHLKTRGKEAMDRLVVHLGVPPEFSQSRPQSVDDAQVRPSVRPPLTLEEISRLLGARL